MSFQIRQRPYEANSGRGPFGPGYFGKIKPSGAFHFQHRKKPYGVQVREFGPAGPPAGRAVFGNLTL